MRLLLLLLAACARAPDDSEPVETDDTVDTVDTEDTAPAGLALEVVASGLQRPLLATSPPGDDRLFLIEQRGYVRVVDATGLRETPFLDLTGSIGLISSEQGLLGLAFHPEYATNGRFFVNYTRSGDGATVVAELGVGADPDVADPSARTLLEIAQPYENHNGGHLAFGPDGFLYVGTGDGGSADDPHDNGQDLTTLLGKLLRIDVDGAQPYAIPAGNPFAGTATQRDEIWAYGLRNPWRFSFDRGTGDLYIGDVGQNRWEEIDVAPADSTGGENYGWNEMEGTRCFRVGCDPTGLVLPVLEYPHAQGCSVTGGYVYRGSIADLQGRYVYGDYCTGFVRTWRRSDGETSDLTSLLDPRGELIVGISSFGEDAAGELLVVSYGNGTVYRIVGR